MGWLERWVRAKVTVWTPTPAGSHACLPAHLTLGARPYIWHLFEGLPALAGRLIPQSSPPTCSCHLPWDPWGLPQLEPLPPGTPTFLATLALASVPLGKGRQEAPTVGLYPSLSSPPQG